MSATFQNIQDNIRLPKNRFDRRFALFSTKRWRKAERKTSWSDVRSPGEYRGEITHMRVSAGRRAGAAARSGAKSMPWKTATNDDATFKPASELAKIYFDQCGVGPERDTIVYCRIGERASHTWFVLTYLLGLDNVRNYDGSWTEWGNKVGAPIEKKRVSGLGSARLARWRWAPSHRELFQCVQPVAVQLRDGISAGRRNVRRGRRRSPIGITPFLFSPVDHGLLIRSRSCG